MDEQTAGAATLLDEVYNSESTTLVAQSGGVRADRAGRLVLLPCWTKTTPPFAPPGGLCRTGAGLLVLQCYPAGQGLCLPSRSQAESAEL